MKQKRHANEARSPLPALSEMPGGNQASGDVIVFNSEMRKTFVEGVIQDAKGYFESKTDGKVAVGYEEFPLKGHEFCFRVVLSKSKGCTKQMFNEVSGAFINVMGYMFQGEFDQYELCFSTNTNKTEAEVVSNW